MKASVALMVIFLGMLGIVNAVQNEGLVLVDTLYAELSLTNSIFHNMETDTYMYFPNYNSLEIRYGRNAWGEPGIVEGRGVVTFQVNPIPEGYDLTRAEIQAYSYWYVDNTNDLIWPMFFSSPYPVQLDHIQFEAMLPTVFGQTPLSSNIAVLQDSAFIGWVGTDITSSYLDDIQQSRIYSQYRLHFPAGYDVLGFQIDMASYGRTDWGIPKLVVTYQQDVSNSDDVVSPPESVLIKRLYPLPVHEVLHVELEKKYRSTASVFLYDLKGRLVNFYDKLNFQNDPVQLHLSDYSSGIYFLKVEAEQKCEVKRITIIK